MATLSKAKPKTSAKSPAKTSLIPIEASKTEDSDSLIYQSLILLYGPPKIGKSTFCNDLGDVIFISTEPGLKFLKTRKMKCSAWKQFLDILDALEEAYESGKLDNDMFIVDTVDNLFAFCRSYVCEKKKIEHPSDLSFGKGWEALGTEWNKAILRLAAMDRGIVFISHSKEKEVTTAGMKQNKTVPSLSGASYAAVNALVDFIFYCDFKKFKHPTTKKVETRRVIITKGDDTIEAGDRTGELPTIIALDAKAFKKAMSEIN